MELKEKVNENVKKLKEDILEIARVVFELNSLIMEMPIIEKPNRKVKKNLVEKYRIVYDKCENNLREAYQLKGLLKRKECKKYVIKLDVYLNALCSLMYVTNGYISIYSCKYKADNDIDAIYTYYKTIMRKLETFDLGNFKYLKDLGEEYYSFD